MSIHLLRFKLRRSRLWQSRRLVATSVLLLAVPHRSALQAAEVHGRVTDPLGAAIAGAQAWRCCRTESIVANTVSGPDGRYIVRTSQAGRFYVVVASSTFKEITTQSFYAGASGGA